MRPWRARRLFCTDSSGFGTAPQKRTADLLTAVTTGFDPALGRTYAELGLEARSHAQVPGDVAAPAAARRRLEAGPTA